MSTIDPRRKRVPFFRRPSVLAEVLVVGIILSLLAVTVAPRLSSAANIEQESALRDALHDLRTQIMVYRAQHSGVAPGYPRGEDL